MFYPFRRFDEDKTYRLMISLIGVHANRTGQELQVVDGRARGMARQRVR